MSKVQKLPRISNDTKLLSFDIETNDLHGTAFAIGAAVVDSAGSIVDKFIGRTEIAKPVDPWVTENVLPVMQNIPINYKNLDELKEAFWQWYLKAEEASDYVVVSNGYPVEYKFLLDCQAADLKNRYWQHPFPILDLTSLILQTGESKKDFVKEFWSSRNPHNPFDDAVVTALAAFKAFRKTAQIK